MLKIMRIWFEYFIEMRANSKLIKKIWTNCTCVITELNDFSKIDFSITITFFVYNFSHSYYKILTIPWWAFFTNLLILKYLKSSQLYSFLWFWQIWRKFFFFQCSKKYFHVTRLVTSSNIPPTQKILKSHRTFR